MNGRTFAKLGTLIILLGLMLGGVAQATTYYVNVVTGLDGKNGLSPTVGADPIGPKQTINNAIAAASAGDTIIVDYGFGNLYNEVVTVTKLLTFGVSSNNGSGTPQVVAWVINNATASPNNVTRFIGPFQFNTGLTLAIGNVVGGANLTVGGTLVRTWQAGGATPTVDAQLNFTGTVNFVYSGAAAGGTITSGFELPPAANTTNFGNLTTDASAGFIVNLVLNESKTMNGVLTTGAGTLNLSGGTLTIVGHSALHTVGGAVSSGTLLFNMDTAAGATITGAFALPGVSATSAVTGGATLAVASSPTVGDVSASGTANVTLAAATTIASINNSGSGTVLVTPAGTVTGNVMLSGTGFITFTAGMSVGGSVALTSVLTVGSAVGPFAQITFADASNTVTGTVTNSATFSGSSTVAINNWGVIFFNATGNPTTLGGVVNNSSSTHTNGTGGSFAGNGDIRFASTGGTAGLGNVTNSSSYDGTVAGTSGRIVFTGVHTAATTAGALLNSSGTTNSTNGSIDFGATSTGSFSGGSVTSQGAAGGVIQFGIGNFSLTGSMTNSRTSAATHISVGGASTPGVNVSIGGNLTNSGASNILFPVFNNGSFAVTGSIVSSGTGTISIEGAVAAVTSISLGGVDISGGTIDLTGAGDNMTTNVGVNGNTNFAGGKFLMNTSAARTLQLGGLMNKFSSANTRTDFANNTTPPLWGGAANVTLLIQPTLVIAAQSVVGNALTAIWYGPMVVSNVSGLQPFATFSGGNIRVLNNVTFQTLALQPGMVQINGMTLFIGGQLAPFVGAGNFANNTGYATDATGFISMNGNAGETVTGAAGAQFANFEMDATGQIVTFTAPLGNFISIFNLTAGTTLGAASINFNNATTFPTIVRNAGLFDVAPTFTSMVNITYIGLDKTTALELPSAVNKLNNLTVATTNGTLTAGQGAVNVGVATQVNGNLTINPGQALVLTGVSLTMGGPNVNLWGDLANAAATDKLVLAAATGTVITGSGVLPDIQVNAGSVGNQINGSTGLATGLLGTAPNTVPGLIVRGGTGTDADINPGSTGSIVYAGGAASSLTAAFGAANTTTGTHLSTIMTATGATFTLGANLILANNLTHAAGTVDVADFSFWHRGNNPMFTTGTVTTGASGKLSFVRTVTVVGVDVVFSAVTGDVTIAANVEVNMASNTAGSDIFEIDPASAGNLICSGTFTLTSGTVQLGNAATARNLTVTGSALTMASGTSFNTVGIGTLRLNAASPPLTFTYSGSPTIARLQVSNDVVLAGNGTALNINAVFTHDGGNLNFGSRTLNVTGTFTRSAGTYTANAAALSNTTGALSGGGWLVIAGANFTQGTGFSIPNLRIASGANFAPATAADFTVTGVFDLQNGAGFTFTHTVSGAPRLNIANNAIINYVSGTLDVAPVFAGSITLVAAVLVNPTTIPATVWPPTPTNLVTSFLVAAGAPATTVTMSAGTFTVNSVLNLIMGTVDLNTNAATLAIANSATIRRQQTATINALGAGNITFGTGLSVIYEPSAPSGPGGDLTTGPELPPTVTNLTFTRLGNVGNASANIASHVTVTGTLTVKNDINNPWSLVGPPAFPAVNGTITVTGNVVINNDANALATGPVMWFDYWGAAGAPVSPLTFAGSTDQTLTLNGNRTIDAIQLSQASGVHNVTIIGGNLTIPGFSGGLIFMNGLLTTGDNTLFLPTATQGFLRNVASGDYSHVVGNVTKNIAFNTPGRFEFPIGTAQGAGVPPYYRPAAITFPFATPLITTAAFNFKTVVGAPGGTVGFPIDAGNFISIESPANFYWLGTSSVGLGAGQFFDLDFTAEGFTGYENGSFGINQLRIIRRFDGDEQTNQWVLQGGAYSNFITNVPTPNTPVIRAVGSVGGLEPQGSRFSIGLGLITDVQKDPTKAIPTEYNLAQNFPNPFNPSTTINFDLPKQSAVTLEIYDVLGQKVSTLVSGETMDPGYYHITWNGTNQSGSTVSTGIYFYRIVADKFTSLKKMMFLK
jgi:hypothetical protein